METITSHMVDRLLWFQFQWSATLGIGLRFHSAANRTLQNMIRDDGHNAERTYAKPWLAAAAKSPRTASPRASDVGSSRGPIRTNPPRLCEKTVDEAPTIN
ncbi:hypothetical protein NO361_25310 [Burkholderia cenocepacia]|nr:hypothetical protein [Burkholderia cenocepacia]